MDLNEVTQWLKDNKYLLDFGGKLYVTSKWIRDSRKENLPVPAAVAVTKESVKESGKERFKRFIKEAEVPYRLSDGQGKQYTANAYNSEADRVFSKALKEGKNWQVLVLSTKLYYKSNAYKQAIGNYFIKGTWESEYDEFVKKMATGKIVEHIKGNTDTNNTNMRLGN